MKAFAIPLILFITGGFRCVLAQGPISTQSPMNESSSTFNFTTDSAFTIIPENESISTSNLTTIDSNDTTTLPQPIEPANLTTLKTTISIARNVTDSTTVESTNATSSCGGEVTDQAGLITSPNFPQNYPDNVVCTWNITVATNQIINVKFTWLDLHIYYNPYCMDNITFFDGPTDQYPRINNVYCGYSFIDTSLDIPIRSKGNQMLVVFRSDSMGSRTGFNITYTALKCDPFTYGRDSCDRNCTCNQMHADYCDNIDGGCVCNGNWTGPNCSILVEHCKDPNICSDPYGICVNVPGSYELKDVCKDFEKLNCSYQCTVDLKQNGFYYCFCPDGYRLIDREKCQDINECGASSTNLCSYKSGCINQEPGYRCTCPAGQRLDNDGRTCLNCSTTTWGINCSTSCSCSTGATRCDNVKGCICKPGYTGVYCDVDVNQCTNGELTCNDRQQCVNRPGPDSCVCKSGYVQTNGFCEDINECSSPALNNCSQLCTNSIGKYSCGCYEGFTYNATTNSCDDINECTLNIHKCTSVCVNTLGNYRCSCKSGYVLNKDGFTCDVSSVCANSSVCQYQCVNNGGVDTCFCPRGQALNNDSRTCRDIDLCQGSPCTDECNETPDNTSIICSCPPGKLLASDGITCQACSSDTWGVNCANNCTCSPPTTFSCKPVTGSCQCLPGWNGTDCSVDINECTLNQTICSSVNNTECLNTNGSYSCVCQLGYGKTSGSDVCQGCNEFFYGKDCSQQCNCNSFHSTCDKTNGTCHCIKGWTGPTCDDDIDECLDTASCNSAKNELCVDTEGSFYCSCQLGYYRPNSTSECTVCPPLYYGEFCSQSCACNSNNANLCNNVNGTCSCKPQWKGTDCTTDVDECQENTYNCPNNSHCTNNNGGYTCDCDSGYFKNTTSNSCQTCACNMSNTVSCDSISGFCLCKTNWQGPTCNDDVNECSKTNLYNCPSNSTCNNTVGGYDCLCLPGFNKNISTNQCDDIDECKDNTFTCPSDSACNNTVGGYNCNCISGYFRNFTSKTCQVCQPFYYGEFCSQSCACNSSNANSCNNVNGTCSCKSQWRGTDCTTDVDECQENTHTCLNNSHCTNVNGGYTCDCNPGYFKKYYQ
ncbi:hypothetical protein Btru_055741 [Bulinus truncatus]|nr:hypothetical protein Btru_055741 [Bulinus truncatus]